MNDVDKKKRRDIEKIKEEIALSHESIDKQLREMKEAARVQYRAIMDRRRKERRRKRIDRLMEGCTEKQKARIRGGQDMRRGRRV